MRSAHPVVACAALLLAGCPTSAPAPVGPVGPVPAVDAQLSFIRSHALRAKTVLEPVVRTTPPARLASDHLDVILSAAPVEVRAEHTAAATRDTPAELPVTLAAAARIARESAEARSDAERRAHADDVKAARRQARLDALAAGLTWLVGIAGAIAGVSTLALAASFALAAQFPPLADVRRALGCVAVAAGVLVVAFSAAVMMLEWAWLPYALAALLVGVIGLAARYLYRLEPKRKS